MKRIAVSFLSLLTIAGIVSSCQKDQHAGNGSKFTATMESCTSSQGKTVLDGSMLNWVDGDQIKVFGSSNAEGVYAAVAGTDDATTATFENVEGDAGSPVFHAIYPASVAMTATSVTLPAEQVTVDGSLTDFPMYATSENNSEIPPHQERCKHQQHQCHHHRRHQRQLHSVIRHRKQARPDQHRLGNQIHHNADLHHTSGHHQRRRLLYVSAPRQLLRHGDCLHHIHRTDLH